MRLTKILQGDHTLSRSYYQIKLPIDLEPVIPDNATIARFISLHLAQCSKELMAGSTWFLRRNGFITSEAVFIDGTKIEANANKYTFVWKKAVNKNKDRMLSKVAEFVAECEVMYGFKVTYNDRISLKTLMRLVKQLKKVCRKERIVFVYGSGKRNVPKTSNASSVITEHSSG